MKTNVTIGALAWLAATQLSAGSAHAQTSAGANELEEIVVTAERRESDVQKTATSVSVRSGAELREQGRYTLGQMLEDVAGITGGAAGAPAPGGSGIDSIAKGLTIRGIKSNDGAVGNVTAVAAAAAVYVDGVYEGVGGGYDIDRVEFLRGPQGTLYGRSATSGLVAIHTADPQLDRFGGNATLEVGNYDLRHYTGVVNAPIVNDVLGVRVAANRYERDGYFSAEGGAVASTDAKVKVLYKPSEDLSLLFGFALQNNDSGSGGTTISLATPDTYAFTDTPLGEGSNEFRQYWALLNWNVGFGTLTYQPAYRTWESEAVASQRTDSVNGIDSAILIPRDRFHTQELRLSSNPDSKLIWQVGALYYENSLASQSSVTTIPANIVVINTLLRDKTTTASGIFAEATYPVADAWRVTAGLRYDHTKVSVVEDYTSFTGVTQTLSGEPGVRTFDNVTYKVRLEHDLTEQNLLYASVSTGFSPGDVSVTTGATGNPYPLELKDETLTAYEIGSKNRLLDNRLQVNGAVYYYDYGAYQVANININTNPASSNQIYATLAAPAKSYGAELETVFQFTQNDRAAVNLAYTHAYFTDKDQLVDTGDGSTVTFGDYFVRDEIPGVTPFTASVSYDHTFRLPGDSTLVLRGAARYMSEHALTNVAETQIASEPYYRVDAQWVGDLSATWAPATKLISVTGYVRNVDDNQYKTTANIQQGSGIAATPYDPRTYGVLLNVDF